MPAGRTDIVSVVFDTPVVNSVAVTTRYAIFIISPIGLSLAPRELRSASVSLLVHSGYCLRSTRDPARWRRARAELSPRARAPGLRGAGRAGDLRLPVNRAAAGCSTT